MSASNIEWTDETWQVTNGCTEKSPGCAGCYAKRMSKRLAAMARADVVAGRDPGKKASYQLVVADDGKWTGVVPTLPAALAEPFGWRKPRTVFVDSMSDLFWGDDDDLADGRRRGVEDPQAVPFEFIAAVFGVMDACPQHTFQVLTKRPARMLAFFEWLCEKASTYSTIGPRWTREATFCSLMARADVPNSASHRMSLSPGRWPLENVVLMTSVENQRTADERVPLLLRCPATRRGLSCEPLLGPVTLRMKIPGMLCKKCGHTYDLDDAVIGVFGAECPKCFDDQMSDVIDYPDNARIDWVIVGGESGPTARPMHPAWARSLRDQCQAAGVPFFFKQWGEWGPLPPEDADGHADRSREHVLADDGTLYDSDDLAYPNGRRRGEAIRKDHHQANLTTTFRVGKHVAGRELDGLTHSEMPSPIGGAR